MKICCDSVAEVLCAEELYFAVEEQVFVREDAQEITAQGCVMFVLGRAAEHTEVQEHYLAVCNRDYLHGTRDNPGTSHSLAEELSPSEVIHVVLVEGFVLIRTLYLPVENNS